jgi:cell division protein FtsI/penicillin-binding protein 2
MNANVNNSILSDRQNWRYNVLALIFLFVSVLLVGQVIRIQISPTAKVFKNQGDNWLGYYRTIMPARGFIYDRWGRIFAGNTMVYEVGVELKEVANPETIARTLSTVLGRDYQRYFASASMQYSLDPENMAVYIVLENNITQEQKDQIDIIKEDIKDYSDRRSKDAKPPSLRGLVIRPQLQRSYPEKELGSNIIGFVNANGEGYGVEKHFHHLLAGNPLTVWVPLDPNKVTDIPDYPKGTSIVLTLSRELQAAMEKVVDDAIESTGSESATIVVMDPVNGEILAMATTPRMDLNRYSEYAQIFTGSTPFNRAVSQSYEIGSVFKIFTMAAALDSGTVTPETVFTDTGVFEVGGIYIRNWNGGAWGPQTMQGCMQHSLNVCMTWLAVEMGANRFYHYMDAFGFGRATGIEISGEDRGRLKMPGDSDWFMSDLGTNSFGQALAATPVQMLMGASAIANEGRMVAPHIVRSTITNGNQYNTPVQVVGTPISRDTAITLTDLLVDSLEKESSDALVEGYRLAGKTGTAQIPTPFGYSSSETNASFIGWGPVDDPRFLVYVWLEKPKTSIWASIVAAPIFAEAVKELVVLMNIPPDHERLQMSMTRNSQ